MMREMVKTKSGLYLPNPVIVRALLRHRPEENVAVILHNDKKILDLIFGKNMVTDEGDKFYGQSACGEVPDRAFSDLYLASAGPVAPAKDDDRSDFTDIAGSNKTKSGGYPKTNDADPDNTGAGVDVISWLFSYATGDGPFAAITHGYITVNAPGAAEHLLCSMKFGASWAKDGDTSAKVFINHTCNGV